jgi:L-seryl-tRNA(Ser) seleniumtransferase
MLKGELNENGTGQENLYRHVPSLNNLLLGPNFQGLLGTHERSVVVQATRDELTALKQQITSGQLSQHNLATYLDLLPDRVSERLQSRLRYSLRRVINATGVLLHTNLGRAPLSTSAIDHLADVAAGYSNLELDLETGERSRRDVHAESLVLNLLKMRAGAAGREEEPKAVVVVNNCAAATFLALDAIARDREVIVSRGELVEIGGGFRIPEILAKSGAQLREVGTTNRTRTADYESAISPATGLILRVHQSNFSMEGFTERPSLPDLVSLARRVRVPVFEDQGTGLLTSLVSQSFPAEETLLESYREGVDLIAASGDKLLGGPQCGLLIGRTNLIERIRANPLLRAFRVDKLTYAALEATLVGYLSNQERSIPIIRMLNIPTVEILERSEWLADRVRSPELSAEVVSAVSVIGGGTTPRAKLQSYAVALRHGTSHCQDLLRSLRHLQVPVVGRICDDRVWLDLRTVEPELDETLAALLAELGGGSPGSKQQA